MRKQWVGLSLALSLAALVMGCDGGGDGTGNTGGQAGDGGSGGAAGGTAGSGGGSSAKPVSIDFEARVGPEVFDCAGTYTGLGTTVAEATITDFRLYVHDVELIVNGTGIPVTLDQDELWQYQNVALLDFESGSGSCANGTAEMNTKITGTVPAGEIDANPYEGIRFKVGVPFELNHADATTAPSPLNFTALFWSWNGGYKFMRADSLPAGAGTSFNIHIGSTECQDDGSGGVSSCGKPNRPQIELTGKDPLVTKIVVDYAGLVQGSDLTQNSGPAGCMSGAADPECGPVFESLGLDIQSGMPTLGQQLFKFDGGGPQ
jgi:uncharacterized repeat protein (TIGR04052 family)